MRMMESEREPFTYKYFKCFSCILIKINQPYLRIMIIFFCVCVSVRVRTHSCSHLHSLAVTFCSLSSAVAVGFSFSYRQPYVSIRLIRYYQCVSFRQFPLIKCAAFLRTHACAFLLIFSLHFV